MALGKEANGGNLGKSFRSSAQYYNCLVNSFVGTQKTSSN